MDQRVRLIGDRARQPRVRVAERGDADAGEQVVVLAAIRVEQALAAGVGDVVIVDGRTSETLAAAATSGSPASATRLVANAGARQP